MPKTPKKREKVLYGKTVRVDTGCGKLYLTINKDKEGKIYEVFCKMEKTGSCFSSICESLARMITLVFRLDGGQDLIAKHLMGIECPSKIDTCKSCPDAIGRIIQEIDKPQTN